MISYSTRLPWLATPNSFSLLLQRQREAGVPLLDLTSANPTTALKDYPDKEIAQAFGEICDFRYYPHALGAAQARNDIAAWYQTQAIPVVPDRIALTASTSEAYALLFKLFCDPGDQVLTPAPSYPLFDHLARAESVQISFYRLSYDGSWFIDFESLRRAVTSRTRAVVIVNPNNPTGSFLKQREWETLCNFAREYKLAIISDEVFMNYPAHAAQGRIPTLIGHNEVLSFSLNGLSKAAAMPQMKLGWIAVNGPEQLAADAMTRLDLLLDNYLSVGAPVQNALPSLLRIGDVLQSKVSERVQQNRLTLQEILRGSPVHVLHSEGGWSAILQLPQILSEEAWIAKLLTDASVVVQPGYFYDMAAEAFAIISLLTPEDVFREALNRLASMASGDPKA